MGLLQRILRPKLDEEEEQIVQLLRKGPMKQTKLREELGVNPVKFNKLMRSLEEKKIAKREPKGRENVVKLL